MKMIDVGAKKKTERVARARGFLAMTARTLGIVRRGEAEKGDVVAAARLAGVIAAKRTPDLIPLCHPIGLSGVEVDVRLRRTGMEAIATVRTVDRTGVEMEALAAAAAACLTAYDMLKRYERGMRIEAIELLEKRGGRTGHWTRSAAAPARGAKRQGEGQRNFLAACRAAVAVTRADDAERGSAGRAAALRGRAVSARRSRSS